MKRKGTKKRTRSQDRELAELLKRANAEHRAAQKALHGGITAGIKKSVPHMMDCGDYLLKAKKRLGHGRYLPWLADTDIPERTAQRYCWMAKHRSEIEAKSATVADLTYRRVIELLTPTATIEETNRDAEPGAIATILAPPGHRPGQRLMMYGAAEGRAKGEPTKQHALTRGDFRRTAAGMFAQHLALFVHYLADHEPDVIAAALSAEKRPTIRENANAIITYLSELICALQETGKPKLVS